MTRGCYTGLMLLFQISGKWKGIKKSIIYTKMPHFLVLFGHWQPLQIESVIVVVGIIAGVTIIVIWHHLCAVLLATSLIAASLYVAYILAYFSNKVHIK